MIYGDRYLNIICKSTFLRIYPSFGTLMNFQLYRLLNVHLSGYRNKHVHKLRWGSQDEFMM